MLLKNISHANLGIFHALDVERHLLCQKDSAVWAKSVLETAQGAACDHPFLVPAVPFDAVGDVSHFEDEISLLELNLLILLAEFGMKMAKILF